MGDNRNNSEDSRFPDVGFVPYDLLKGKAMLVFWPLSAWIKSMASSTGKAKSSSNRSIKTRDRSTKALRRYRPKKDGSISILPVK